MTGRRGASSSSDARALVEFPEPAEPGLTCTFWPAISVGLGGRGGGCRSPPLITYCSRLTSRAQESAQLCTRTTLLEHRSSNSGWLWGGVRGAGGHQAGLHPRHTQTGLGLVFPGLGSLLPSTSAEGGSKWRPESEGASPRATQRSRSVLPA